MREGVVPPVMPIFEVAFMKNLLITNINKQRNRIWMDVWFEEQPLPAIIRCYKIGLVSAMKWNYPWAKH